MQHRIVVYEAPGSGGATGHCLDPHDLVISKLVAHRDKDLEFAGALLHAGLVDVDVLVDRAQKLTVPLKSKMVIGWLLAWSKRHGTPKSGSTG